ncbi:PA14 domain-containing protein [Opitutales bacterium]|nr:PA14 domain-containing protein [Opitutales bacterium]
MKRLSTILVILVLLFCGMTNASFARDVGKAESARHTLLVSVVVKENALVAKHMPAGRFLGSEQELRAFWHFMGAKKELPSVDFSKQLIFLLPENPNDSNIRSSPLGLIDGDLRLGIGFSTLAGVRPSPVTRVGLLTTARAGVETVNGVAVGRNPWPKIPSWQQTAEKPLPKPTEVEVAPSSLRNLTFSYYEGLWKSFPDFDKLTPKKSDALTGNLLSAEIREREDNYAIRFSGKIFAPEDGEYVFTVRSPGVRLMVGDATVVDGLKSAGVQLRQGEHAFTFDYLRVSKNGRLAATWRGPGIDGEQSLVAEDRSERVEVLSSHRTIAAFTGLAFSSTGKGNYASFDVQTYLDYQKLGRYGSEETSSFAFCVMLIDGSRPGQLEALYHRRWSLGTPAQVALAESLTKGDLVELGWNRESRDNIKMGVTRGCSPVTLLRRLTTDEAEALKKSLEDRERAQAQSQKSGAYYEPAAFAERLIAKFPKRFGSTAPEKFASVKQLSFEGLHVGEDDFICIGKLTSLETLIFDGCKFEGKYLQHLVNLQQLQTLNLSAALMRNSPESTDAALAHIGKLKNLRHLNLEYATISDVGLAHLSGLQELRRLEIPSPTDEELARLSGFGKLEYLRIFRPELKGTGFAHLRTLKNLRQLVLKEGHLSENLFPNLAKVSSLSQVNLWGTGGFSAKHVDELAALKDLKLLDLRRSFLGQQEFTAQDVKSLKAALPGCTIRVGNGW